MAEAKKVSKSKKAETKSAKKEVKEVELVVETAPVNGTEEKSDKPKAVAKAGKRSPKALKEVEDQELKTKRKTTAPAKPVKKPTRPKAERAGKKYREAAKLIENDKTYSLAEAVNLALKTSTVKFDATLELHVRLGVDPKQADQNVRATVPLPGGSGKQVKIAVLADGPQAEAAKKAGAELVGSEAIFSQLDKGEINFDSLITTPAMMPALGKYARLLGPRGLMPNPKSGTATADVAKAVTEAKAGKVEYRVDQAGIIHLGIGRLSLGEDKLLANASAVMDSIKAARPSGVKGVYIRSAFVSTTMGPSIKLEIS